jgi:anti-anti-sigma regulatory factor
MIFAPFLIPRHLKKKANMEISVKTEPNQKTIKIRGSVNALDVAKLKQTLWDAARFSRVTIDLTETDFVCTGFINMLVELKNMVPGISRRFLILNPGILILELLEMTHIAKIFKIETQPDAVKK